MSNELNYLLFVYFDLCSIFSNELNYLLFVYFDLSSILQMSGVVFRPIYLIKKTILHYVCNQLKIQPLLVEVLIVGIEVEEEVVMRAA